MAIKTGEQGLAVDILSMWYDPNETWTYGSADDPTFTFTVPGDKTTTYYPGMRIKLTQTSVKYFVVTKVAYINPTTTVTIYGGNSYDLTSAAITGNYISSAKCPTGFPLERSNWDLTGSLSISQASPAQNTWYTGGNITLPIGDWTIYVNSQCNWVIGGGVAGAYTGSIYLTLSDANNTESDATSTRDMVGQVYESAGYSWNWSGNLVLIEDKIQTAKAIWYINGKTANASLSSIGVSGDIIARFNYI